MINSRQLDAFAATARTGSMTAAARLIGSSQPSVSRFIADLEARLGMALFSRERGRLQLTQEGSQFFAELERYYDGQQELIRRAADIRRFASGEVRIAGLPAAAYGLIPQAIAAAVEAFGEIRTAVQMRSAGRVAEFLETGRIDVGVVNRLDPGTQVRRSRAFDLSCVMVLPAGHRLAARPQLGPDDLEGERFISLGAEYYMQHCADAAAAKVLSSSGYRSTNLALPACGQVAAGLGIALADPLTARLAESMGLVALPFRPVVSYPIAIAESALTRPSRAATAIYDALEHLLTRST